MIKLKEHYFNLQFIRFMSTGGAAAIVNFCSRIFLSHYMNYPEAIAVAYLIGMATAYCLFKLIVFDKSSNSIMTQIGWYSLINAVALIQTVLVSLLFANILLKDILTNQAFREAIAHFIGLSSTLFTSFLGHKYMTFKQ